MNKTMGLLALTAALLFCASGARAADYRPVVFSYTWNSRLQVWLIGAFKDGKWYRNEELPLEVNGRPLTSEEVMEQRKPAVCVVPALAKGDRLSFHSVEGEKSGSRTVREILFSRSITDEIFIEAETDGEALSASVSIGISEGWDAIPGPTRRSVSGKGVEFALEDRLSVAFIPDTDEDEERFYRGFLVLDGKNLPLTEAYVDSTDELEGFFIDVNGDGRPEFVLFARGAADFVGVFDLPSDADPAEVLSLDFGD